MDRTEARLKLNLILNENKSPYKLIDDIFDDFESRTCQNCKYFNVSECSIILPFESIDGLGTLGTMEVDSDFSCSRFERKENAN